MISFTCPWNNQGGYGRFLVAFAQNEATIDVNPNIPGSNPANRPEGIIANIYQFALLIGGLLAFGAIVYGAVKYTLAAGNPSGQGDARDQITQALLGLLLLVGSYLILKTLNPDLVSLKLPTLEALKENEESWSEGGGGTTCQANRNQCNESPGVAAIKSCMQASGVNLGQVTTTGGTHSVNSCHFGGSSCTDGGHAIDFGNETNQQAILAAMAKCAASGGNLLHRQIEYNCHCEDRNGNRYPTCDPPVNHIHCNVDNASCGCN